MCRPYLQNRRTTRLTAQWMGMNERRVRGRRREEEVTVELNESLTSGLQDDARTGAVDMTSAVKYQDHLTIVRIVSLMRHGGCSSHR